MVTYVTNIVEYKNSFYITYLQLWYKKNVDNVNLLKLFPFSLLLLQYTYALIPVTITFNTRSRIGSPL